MANKLQLHFDNPGTAVVSDCNKFRYSLSRSWGPGARMLFVMLNPSTADAIDDDPTIRRCIGFAKREKCEQIEVVNLFAYRATDPRELLKHGLVDSIGVHNRHYIQAAAKRAAIIVFAWGAHRAARMILDDALSMEVNVTAWIQAVVSVPIHNLGITKNYSPRHPLYLPANAPLLPYH